MSHLFRTAFFAAVAVAWLAVSGAAPWQPGAAEARSKTAPVAPGKQTRVIVAQHGKGFTELINGQMVIHLEGTPYEMGFQMGKMLPIQTRQNCDAYVTYFALENRKMTMDELLNIWKAAEPFVPQSFKDEMRGLAEGAGIPLDLVIAAHALPEKFHCSGAAVWGGMTRDGKLYHYRSLDYALHLGKDVKVQENAAVIVRKPTGKVPSLVVGWAGVLGCVTGMNAKGLSIGEMGCSSNDETYAGFPMFFLLRYCLEESETLDQALTIMRRAPRTSGYNFIFTDGKAPKPRAVALEVDHSRMVVFEGGDKQEDVAPHFSIPECVRRVNHFVDPTMAGRQRKVYDPRVSEQASWMGYKLISDYIAANKGKMTGEKMIEVCRAYPPTHSCLHQAVMCPSDGRIWVANALDPDDTVFAGAQNQTFHPYNLHDLLATQPEKMPRGEMVIQGPKPKAEVRTRTGTARGTPLAGPEPQDAGLREIYQRYVKAAGDAAKGGEFSYRIMDSGQGTKDIATVDLAFPSAVKNGPESNNTVWARCFYKRSQNMSATGRQPALVLLHHLHDEQTLETMLANYFATGGRFVAMMYLPFYGPRHKDLQGGHRSILETDLADSFVNFAQGIWDIHRLRDWMRSQPFIDAQRVYIMGVSLGGIAASVSAGVDPGFDKYALCLAGGDFPAIIGAGSREVREIADALQRQGVTPEKVKELTRPFDPLTFASRADGKKCS